jgi:hypothetical protein
MLEFWYKIVNFGTRACACRYVELFPSSRKQAMEQLGMPHLAQGNINPVSECVCV